MKNDQSLKVSTERQNIIFIDRFFYIAGLFRDEQVKDAFQSDK